jgi:hypothetical protein
LVGGSETPAGIIPYAALPSLEQTRFGWHASCCRSYSPRNVRATANGSVTPAPDARPKEVAAMDLRIARVVEDHTTTPLGPDTLVPSQYFDQVGADAAFQPEKRLMLAVLEEAIATFQRHVLSETRRGKRLVEEVEEWVAGMGGEWPFSFDNICAALDLDPQYLRAGMDRWKQTERRKLRSGKPSLYRFPFRRVNGRRHSITGPREYLRQSA